MFTFWPWEYWKNSAQNYLMIDTYFKWNYVWFIYFWLGNDTSEPSYRFKKASSDDRIVLAVDWYYDSLYEIKDWKIKECC